MPKYTRTQKDKVARKLHELMSYMAIVILHTTKKIIEPSTEPSLKEFEIDVLDNIEMTAQLLYDDLSPDQKKFLRKLASNVLEEL